MNIKFYKDKGKKLTANNVFLVDLDEKWNGELYPNQLMGYLPIGQHGAIAREYIDSNAVEITKEQYIKASEGIYTPKEYLV